jgi:Holliday junction resolvasome RuvABC DNA-binding subunit
MENILTEPWTNAACLGYTISALENLGYKSDDIRLVTAEMKELFDWVSVDEAKAYYNGSPS